MNDDIPDPVPGPAAAEEEASDERLARIVERPDGYYWLAFDGHQEFGPFQSIEAALADMSEAEEGAIEPGETLAEAEQELGMADWIDPETGEPAEETSTRIEES